MSLKHLMDEIQVDPKFVEGRIPTDRMCEGCLIRRAEHIHHREHKAMGGRKGSARTKSESQDNKIALCEVCRRASHSLRYFGTPTPVYPKGFSCGVCPRRFQCYYGARLLGFPHQGVDPAVVIAQTR